MRRLPGAFALFVVGVIVVPPTGCAVRSDEFLCEDAVAKLQSCCPSSSVASSIDCHYYESCSDTTYPQIDERRALHHRRELQRPRERKLRWIRRVMSVKRLVVASALSIALGWARSSSASTFEGELDVGFSQRVLYQVPIEMGACTLMVGAQVPHFAWSLPIGVELGQTFEGLMVAQWGGRMLLEAIEGRVRFGFGFGFGGVVIPRVTQTSPGTLSALFLEIAARVSVDVIRFGRTHAEVDEPATSPSALLLALEFRGNTAAVWGPSLFVGVRY